MMLLMLHNVHIEEFVRVGVHWKHETRNTLPYRKRGARKSDGMNWNATTSAISHQTKDDISHQTRDTSQTPNRQTAPACAILCLTKQWKKKRGSTHIPPILYLNSTTYFGRTPTTHQPQTRSRKQEIASTRHLSSTQLYYH